MLASGTLKGLICCVLKSGGDFSPAHVEWLKRQCEQHMADWTFVCWSDMDVPDCMPLRHGWPKWWSKMEIYGNPYLGSLPALVIDLDTVFLKPLIIKPQHQNHALFLRDPWKDGFRKPERLAAGFTYLPAWARTLIWDAWIQQGPHEVMEANCGDDQPFLHHLFAHRALRWQDHYIDQVVSYKAQVQALGVQKENRIVYFHGLPRPWNAPDEWIPKLTTQSEELTA